jgi:oligopeptide transport system permease protein
MTAVLFAVVTFTFFLVRMAPGSPFASEKLNDPVKKAQLERRHNIDGSLVSQYLRYLGLARKNPDGYPESSHTRHSDGRILGPVSGLLQGDMADSFKLRERRVVEIISQALPVSVAIGAGAFLISTVAGVFLGSLAACKKGSVVDTGAMLLALAAVSVPTFVVGPALVLVFAIWLRWLPVGGLQSWDSIVLPSVALAGPYIAYIARLMRASMLEVLDQDFIRTARAKGVGESQIVLRHALKVAILPVVSFLGPLAANLLTGSMVIETVFNLPGIGPFFVNSILNRDHNVLIGVVVVYCTLLVVLNLIVDIFYTVLDRRIKLYA